MALEYAARTGNRWSVLITLPRKSITPPALASFDGRLHVALVRKDKAVMWSCLENGMWRKPAQVGGDLSIFAPALCAGHGKRSSSASVFLPDAASVVSRGLR
ncbi:MULTISPECIES: hypothetical protein [unclassified Streptomyces]|uniref:Uncharacterized protein n=1 Tax=Streptomyces sp. NBC_00060 TaxID=2975636 RepID=A0AAU2HBW1_9ACTN